MSFPLAILHRSALSIGVDGRAEAHAIVGFGRHDMSRYTTMWVHKPGAPHAFGICFLPLSSLSALLPGSSVTKMLLGYLGRGRRS